MFCYNIALHGPNDIYHQVLAAFAARKCIYSTRAANGKTGTVEGEKSKLFVWLASILPSQPVIGMTILPFSAKSGFSRVGIAWKDLRFRKESPCFFSLCSRKSICYDWVGNFTGLGRRLVPRLMLLLRLSSIEMKPIGLGKSWKQAWSDCCCWYFITDT